MKGWLVLLGAAAAAAAAFFQAPASRMATDFVPPGALLTVEAKDFAAVVRDWNTSGEKRAWLESANFASFSRSNLYLKLESAKNEFAAAAGVPVEASLMEAVAGGESALAIYDIGRLHFLYVSRLPQARVAQTALWQRRTEFSPRSAGGQTFYIRVDPASNRVAAFASASDWLVLATREDLIAGALALMLGQGDSVRKERWYEGASGAARARGDLRVVMDVDRLARTPHFRTYWIQRNVSDVRAFWTGIADLHRLAGELREERLLLRREAGQAVSTNLAGLVGLAPPGTGFYRAWAYPTADQAVAMLVRKIAPSNNSRGAPSKFAPVLDREGTGAGTEADLEIRIDDPPFRDTADSLAVEPIRRLFEGARMEGMMQIESTRVLADGVFVDTEGAVAIQGASDWDAAAVRRALSEFVQPLWGTDLTIEVRGRILIVSRSADLARRVSAMASNATGNTTAAYVARLDHEREQPNYLKMMRLIDHPFIESQPGAEDTSRAPQFFSENVASLSGLLSRIRSAEIVVRDTGAALEQTVTYRLK